MDCCYLHVVSGAPGGEAFRGEDLRLAASWLSTSAGVGNPHEGGRTWSPTSVIKVKANDFMSIYADLHSPPKDRAPCRIDERGGVCGRSAGWGNLMSIFSFNTLK